MSVSIVPTLDMERAIAASGYDVIVGFDEVGRGSLFWALLTRISKLMEEWRNW